MELLPCRFCGTAPNAAISVVPAADRHYVRHVCMGPYHTTMETAAAEWNAANAATDPALLALARLGAMVISGYLRQNDTAELCLMAGLTEETPAGHAHRFPGIINAIAALLATDGAGEVGDE